MKTALISLLAISVLVLASCGSNSKDLSTDDLWNMGERAGFTDSGWIQKGIARIVSIDAVSDREYRGVEYQAVELTLERPSGAIVGCEVDVYMNDRGEPFLFTTFMCDDL